MQGVPSDADKVELLDAIRAVACKDIPDCSVMLVEDSRRRLNSNNDDNNGCILATNVTNVGYTVRVVLGSSDVAKPYASAIDSPRAEV